MIKVEKLSYSYPTKDLYQKVSFSIEENRHAVLIGSNGTGKTTLVQILMDPDEFLYDGKVTRNIGGRIGYVSQFEKREKERDITVFDFLAEDFVKLQAEMESVCAEMETAEDFDALMERYQQILDETTALDADHYDSNIHKELKTAGLSDLAELSISVISGGEYKLLQVIRQMLRKPSLLVMDEPDAFLDFANLKGLKNLINHYQGTLLVVTHNRYLLNHCFDKILHLENADIQEFDGNFVEYNFALLAKKIELQEVVAEQEEEIERSRKVVEKMRATATKMAVASLGRALHAKESYLERLEARKIKEPFVDLRQPEILLPQISEGELAEGEDAKEILNVEDYRIAYEETLLDQVSFSLKANEKVAIVGANGTGKTTLLRDIFRNNNNSISIAQDVKVGFLSQIHEEMLKETNTVYEEMEEVELPFENRKEIEDYLAKYCFDSEMLSNRIEMLSGGEKNLLQLAKIGRSQANLLILDEPTSHLDTYTQLALEKAIAEYQGAVLMVSHDFYTIVNCADYILFVEDKGIRKMRTRTFRKMIYEDHFKMEYLELEQKKKELEQRIEGFLRKRDFESARSVCEQLDETIKLMKDKI